MNAVDKPQLALVLTKAGPRMKPRELNERMAEASGGRTHQRHRKMPPAGFEDHLGCSDPL